MAEPEVELVTVTQKEGDTFGVSHKGVVALQGLKHAEPLNHHVGGEVVHSGIANRPLVHVVAWDEDCACTIEGRVTLVGDEKAPLRVNHRFDNDHHQTHAVKTALAEPIHHALQMRTPLQVRFCNAWQIASDYTLEISMGGLRVIGVRLTGATFAKPLPCEEELCPPVVAPPSHP